MDDKKSDGKADADRSRRRWDFKDWVLAVLVLAVLAAFFYVIIFTLRDPHIQVSADIAVNATLMAAAIFAIFAVTFGFLAFSLRREMQNEYDRMIDIRKEANDVLNKIQKNHKKALKIKKEIERSNEVQAEFTIANIKSQEGDYDEAIMNFDRVIQINPNYAAAHNNRGIVKYKTNDYKGALEDYNRAIEINPNYAEAHNNRGIVKAAIDDKEGALEDYNRAIQLNPNYADAYNNRGILKASMNDNKGALEDYNRAIVINPNYAAAHNNRGIVKAAIYDKEGAMEDYNRAIQLDPNYADAYNNRGTLKAAMDDKKGALEDYDRAIKLAPPKAAGYTGLAWLFATSRDEKFRDPKRAVELAEKAVQLSERKDHGHLDTLAVAYAAAGRFEDAERTQQEAVDLLRPEEKEAKDEYESRLELYKNKKPYIEEPKGS